MTLNATIAVKLYSIVVVPPRFEQPHMYKRSIHVASDSNSPPHSTFQLHSLASTYNLAFLSSISVSFHITFRSSCMSICCQRSRHQQLHHQHSFGAPVRTSCEKVGRIHSLLLHLRHSRLPTHVNRRRAVGRDVSPELSSSPSVRKSVLAESTDNLFSSGS